MEKDKDLGAVTRGKYQIRHFSGAPIKKLVAGEPITIQGLEEFNFIVHESYKPFDYRDKVTITHVETGASLAVERSLEMCLKSISDRLLKLGKQRFLEALEKIKRDIRDYERNPATNSRPRRRNQKARSSPKRND